MWMLTSDDDGHWYVIPVVMEKEFEDYVCKIANGGDPDQPEWAREVGGSPTLVHFPDGWTIS
jgi:hypothetical protein